VPFVAITLLAGLQTISPSLYEAAAIDGATAWQRFRHITMPLLTPMIAVVMTFSVLFTFTDFQLIYVLTRGGPLNATHLMATLSFQRAISGGALGEGAAIAAAILSGELQTSDFFVSTEHALGTFIFDEENENGLTFSTLIPKGHKLPAKVSSTYFPAVRETESLKIRVVEGDPGADLDKQDFVVLKEWDVKLVEKYSDTSTRSFNLQYEYDVDGILHVLATDEESGTVLLDDDVSYGIATNKREMKKVPTVCVKQLSLGLFLMMQKLN
jgi:hypothetical protein